MRILSRVMQGLFILAVPMVLLSASIAAAVNSQWLYEYDFREYQVARTTGLAPAELEKAARGLIAYFNSGEEYIRLTVLKDGQPFELFNRREVEHLKDVKDLFWLDYRILAVALAYGLAYAGACLFGRRKSGRRELAGGLAGGGALTLAAMLGLGLVALADFDRFFLQFHLLSFANDLWQLDPSRDYLIMLFPAGFWQDATLFIALLATLGAIMLGGAGWWYRRRYTLTAY